MKELVLTFPDSITLSASNAIRNLPKEQILFVEIKDDRILIHATEGTFAEAINQKNLVNEFEHDHEFVRISDDIILNLSHVDSIINYTLCIGLRFFKVMPAYRKQVFGEE